MVKIIMRAAGVLLLSVIIWRLIGYLNDRYLGDAYNQTHHFFIAVITALLSIILIDSVRRMDKLSWKKLGLDTLRKNAVSFLLGFMVWAIPAALGLIICIMAGWVQITAQTDFSQLLWSVLILLVTVFFIEALPEELIFRGLIYRYFHSLFPHGVTLFMQALVFSLFGYLIGALYSFEQLLFLPGFALILGYLRAVSGNIFTAIGFHTAMMTVTQILSPLHGHFDVSGMLTLQFFAFILIPSAVGAIALEFIYPKPKWLYKEAI
jgi:membrane protease YdiL (CAAX protease family)